MDLRTFLAHRWWLLPFLFVVVAGTATTNRGDVAATVIGIAAGVAVLAVDWWLPAVLVNGLLLGLYFAVGGENGPAFLTVVVAVLLAAGRSRVRAWLPHVLVAGVAVWAGLLVRGTMHEPLHVGLWQSFGIGALVAAAASVATSARVRRAARQDRLERVAADEKVRMAQDLHDGVGHGLAVIAMQAGAALHVLDTDPARARASLEAIRATSRESLEALRAELATLSGGRPGEAAPRRPAPGPADLPALVDRVRAAGLRVDVEGTAGSTSGEVGGVVHAVVQEALTNVLRHADASRARVSFSRSPERLVVEVADDGRGATDVGEPGLGLAGMAARVGAVGGRLSAGPATGPGEAGFRVRAELPLTRQDGGR